MIAIAGGAFLVVGGRKPDPPVEPVPALPPVVPIEQPVPEKPPIKQTDPEKKPPAKFPASPASPSSIPGLKFHLPLDSKIGTTTLDFSSIKYVGKLAEGVEIVTGKRGKAFQFPLTGRVAGSTAPASGLDLSDVRDKFGVEENAAITYCFWANTADLTRNTPQLFSLGQDRPIERPRLSISASKTGGSVFLSFDAGDIASATFTYPAESTWHHFALRRSTSGIWTCFVDGTAYEIRRKSTVASPKLGFAKVTVGGTVSTTVAGIKPTVAIDDVCIYGRELSNAEIGRLAGKD